MFSIDQNCHPLWDVVPKLHALRAAGRDVHHFVEDIDVAFTAVGARADSGHMEIARERYHRSGGQDWGAALFYSEFLGRLPVEIRGFEPMTGLKTSSLAKHLNRSVDSLYDEFSPGDNWQLIGSSYVNDRDHHRVIGDLGVDEVAPYLREILHRARGDMLHQFPAPDCRQRIDAWFDREQHRLLVLLETYHNRSLVELYTAWLDVFLDDGVRLERTSELFSVDAPRATTRLLVAFLRDYDTAAGLYNRAIEQTDSPLRPLKRKEGELPFFATVRHHGHLVRCRMNLHEDALDICGRHVRLSRDEEVLLRHLSAAGIEAVAGKALLMVIQTRIGGESEPLAVPYRGSLYMPTAHRLAALLAEHDVLCDPLHPIVRVRFRLLDRMAGLDTPIRLPEHLVQAMGTEETTADELAASWADLAAEARRRLETLRDDEGREAWQREACADLQSRIDELDRRRIEIVKDNPKDPEARELWKQVRTLRSEILDRTLRQIDRDWQVAELDYWDSRGALLPWSIALGGEAFYDEIVRNAELYEETAAADSPS